jgi:hypothetical protein
MNEDKELKEAMGVGKKAIIWIVCLGLIISSIGFICNRAVATVDNGIIHYEEFQELFNTCQKLNTDLCNMESLPETDVMFSQFSKAQRINTLKTSLNRWVEDYNGKSKMWNRSLWKSSSLPYQLDVNQFTCYTNK